MLDPERTVKQCEGLTLAPPPARTSAEMYQTRVLATLLFVAAVAACDGTLTGMGRVPREPEPPLPPAPVETASPAGESAGGPNAPPSDRPEVIAAQHLLVMYQGSRSAAPGIKRTHDEARARAYEALGRIKAGQDFDKVVAAYTDEPGGANRHGELGHFTRDKMVKPFSDAAFALDVGQVSTVIESPFGFHIIRRTE
jgi:PPIC-type PPIASE domain